MADIDAIERLLCQRYNVAALDGGELSAGLVAARTGNVGPLRAALDARELYRWRDAIYEALDAPEAEAETEPEAEGIGTLTIAELRAFAEENGIDLGDAKRKGDIIAAIELAQETTEETSPVAPTT